jgi:predicted DNA-binding transcriptional regulator YafY
LKNNKKQNIGCLKIFQLLTLLYEDEADYKKVFNIFKDEIEDQSPNNIQVSVNKYINTLKVFGIKLVKEKHKYKLLSSLYALDLDLEDLKALSILISSAEKFPVKTVSKNAKDFLNNIKLRMGNRDKLKLSNLRTNFECDFSFYYSNVRDQIEQCQELCQENFMVYLIYLKKKKEICIKCKPKEVIYDSKMAYLKIYDEVKKETLEIPMTSILSIAKLPQLANKIEMSTTVVYKLKNRLAKTYMLKEGEYSEGFDNEGNQIIVNRNETTEKLLQRLMRYSFNCEVISPKQIREEMIKRIGQTISQYDEEN